MKDKLLYGTIGLLVGIVVMQWTMPPTGASVVTPPVGNVVGLRATCVLMTDGSVWQLVDNGGAREWRHISHVTMPIANIQFFECGSLVDKNGDMWEESSPGQWVNYGQPPIGPVASDQSTWGKVKAQFNKKGE